MVYLAHTNGERQQTLREHLQNTAALAKLFASAFGAGAFAEMTALSHDVGKYSDAFQRRIRGDSNRVDHSTPAAQIIREELGMIPAYCVAGHHGGLPDGGSSADTGDSATLCGRLKRINVPDCGAYKNEITLSAAAPPDIHIIGTGGFTAAFFIRMLFSCLVDADYLDTERFMSGDKVRRGVYDELPVLYYRLKMHTYSFFPPEGRLNKKRCEILRTCERAGASERGLFTLTVPTGGGKTLSSLAFALNHAVRHGMDRVIYVIPYTNIIEQTAQVFRDILGNTNVLEHHSSYEYDDKDEASDPKRLAAENWDAPVVVTTNVQFFQSLFACKPSRCRKLHNIANSVVIFDEAQMLPQQYLKPCLRAITELTVNYRSTCVLCTATQPNIGPLLPDGITATEICPNTEELYNFFRRVRYEQLGCLSDEELAARLRQHKQVLCIVPTRKQAQALYTLIDSEDSFHLSTLMYPENRECVLSVISSRLDVGLPCVVVSTSLVEAGVDLDFPVVYRAEAGLDSIIQAGGRCNRNGKNTSGDNPVYIFKPEAKYSVPSPLRLPTEIALMVIRDKPDLAAPEAIEAYFTQLYKLRGGNLDSQGIIPSFENGSRSKSFPFATVASQFHIIEQDTLSVLIPSDNSSEIIEKLSSGERSRELLRASGRFSVNIYPGHHAALNRAGALQILDGGLSILKDANLYSKITGLALDIEEGKGMFK